MKKDKIKKTAAADAVVDETSVAKDRVVDPAANNNLAEFAKGKNAADAKKAAAKAAKEPKVAKDGRPKLPPLPRAAGKPKPFKDCGCGCGMKTRSEFAPGHDSRLRGWALRVARGIVTVEGIRELAGDGEANAVAAHVKHLKKESPEEWEALKTPTAPKKKAAAAE